MSSAWNVSSTMPTIYDLRVIVFAILFQVYYSNTTKRKGNHMNKDAKDQKEGNYMRKGKEVK